MERSRANKKKFQMRSPFKGSIGEFMAMGSALGKSDPKTKYASIDPVKSYKQGLELAQLEEKEDEKSDKESKSSTLYSKLIPKEVTEDTKLEKTHNFAPGDNRLKIRLENE